MNVIRYIPKIFLIGFPLSVVMAIVGGVLGHDILVFVGIVSSLLLILWEIIWEFSILPELERRGIVR